MPLDYAKKKILLEEGSALNPSFDERGLITAVAVDVHSKEVLMVATMNAEALAKTLNTGEAHYWSRSRQALWHKGATSGHIQRVVSLRIDCDQDAVVLNVEQLGPGNCHVGYNSCFYRIIKRQDGQFILLIDRQKAYNPAEVYPG
jgi:phosphoribosyl-AMP cyclohydrolase